VESAGWLEELARRYEALSRFTEETVEKVLSELAEEQGVKKARIIHPTRLAVSGVPHGPGLYEMLATLGQPIVVERMKMAVEHINKNQ